jgi:hypothetical protein
MLVFIFSFTFICTLILITSPLVAGRKLRRKVDKISWAARHRDEGYLNVSYKGKTFSIMVLAEKVPDGLRYKTIPVYTCKNIYVDKELVAKLHTMESLWSKYSIIEVSDDRHEWEVEELINEAYKVAKKLENERISKLTAESAKSLYN